MSPARSGNRNGWFLKLGAGCFMLNNLPLGLECAATSHNAVQPQKGNERCRMYIWERS